MATPNDLDSGNLRDLSHQLCLYIAYVKEDGRFSNINITGELSKENVGNRAKTILTIGLSIC